MNFKNYKDGKTLSLANALYLSNENLARKIKQNDFYYISCMNDKILGDDRLIKCEIGSISYVLALICKYKFPQMNYFDELDEGYLSGECNVGEEEFEWLNEWLKDVKNIIIDRSFFYHKDCKMLFEFLNILGVDVVLADGDQSGFEVDGKLNELNELDSFDGCVIYQFLSETESFKGGQNFSIASKLKDKEKALIRSSCGFEKMVEFSLDKELKGTVALLGTQKIDGYNFKSIRAIKA